MKLFRLSVLLGLALLTLVLFWKPSRPQLLVQHVSSQQVSGAAAIYCRAFVAMPKLSDAETKLLETSPEQPLDVSQATKLLAKLAPSMELVVQGAKEPRCNWGLDLSQGAELALPHLGKSIILTEAFRLRARLHLDAGNADSATNDLLTTLRFGRHLGEPPLISLTLARLDSDFKAISLASSYLSKFEPVSLQKLSIGIDALPPCHSIKEATAIEKETFPESLRRLVAKEKEKSSWRVYFDNIKGGVIDSNPVWSALKKRMRQSPATFLEWVAGLERGYEELENLMGLPYSVGKPRIDAFLKKTKDGATLNPLAAVTFPDVARSREIEAQEEMIWAIFRMALYTQAHNPTALQGQLRVCRDTSGCGLVECRNVSGGVEVAYKITGGILKPVTLKVGLEKK